MRQQSDGTFAPDRTGQQFERSEFVRQGAWQDDSSFYCRFVESVADCDHAVHWPTKWPFVGGVVSLNGTFHLSNGLIFRPRTNDASDPVRRSARALANALDPILNLGIWGAKPSSFMWSGNHFTAEIGYLEQLTQDHPHATAQEIAAIAESQPPLAGELIVENGWPASIVMPARSIRIEYAYDKSNYLGRGMPNQIRIFHYFTELHNEFEIVKCMFSSQPFESDFFNPERFFEPGNRAHVCKGESGEYLFDDPKARRAWIEAMRPRNLPN